MYVRRKRFVVKKRGDLYIGSNCHSVVPTTTSMPRTSKTTRTLIIIALVLAILVAVPATLIALKPFQSMAFRVDPCVYEALASGESINAYISASGDVDLSSLSLTPTKHWSFGSLRIYKVKLSSMTQLQKLLSNNKVLSIYAEKKLHHSPLHFLDPSEYPFKEEDIDNKFHEAYGPWIGRNVTVAIIDTGIDYTHPDFYDENNKSIIKVLVSVIYLSDGKPTTWIPYVNGTMDDLLAFDKQIWDKYGEPAFLDINGHGTHVAGIIAGRGWASRGKYRGIAPGAYLVIIKAFNKDGSATMDLCLEALEWVYNYSKVYDIKILSLSWGAAFASDGNDPLSLAVDAIVRDKGVWVFVAAGNEGNIPTTITVPAVAKLAFAVGAWDAYYDKVAPFSSLGPTIDMRMKPDFMGAGVFIVSCRSQFVDFPDEYEVGKYYVALSGTSMATPAVAGVAADFIEYYRYWHHKDPTRDDFIQWVLENGRHINVVKDFLTGWGIPVAPHS